MTPAEKPVPARERPAFWGVCSVVFPAVLCAFFLLSSLITLLCRWHFVPYNGWVFGGVLAASLGLTALVCLIDKSGYENKPKQFFCSALPGLCLLFLVFENDCLPGRSMLATAVVCGALCALVYFKATLPGGARNFAGGLALVALLLGLCMWLPPIVNNDDFNLRWSQRVYSDTGYVAAVEARRGMGGSYTVSAKVHKTLPFSLGLGRYESIAAADTGGYTVGSGEFAPPTVSWNGDTLFFNGEESLFDFK